MVCGQQGPGRGSAGHVAPAASHDSLTNVIRQSSHRPDRMQVPWPKDFGSGRRGFSESLPPEMEPGIPRAARPGRSLPHAIFPDESLGLPRCPKVPLSPGCFRLTESSRGRASFAHARRAQYAKYAKYAKYERAIGRAGTGSRRSQAVGHDSDRSGGTEGIWDVCTDFEDWVAERSSCGGGIPGRSRAVLAADRYRDIRGNRGLVRLPGAVI